MPCATAMVLIPLLASSQVIHAFLFLNAFRIELITFIIIEANNTVMWWKSREGVQYEEKRQSTYRSFAFSVNVDKLRLCVVLILEN